MKLWQIGIGIDSWPKYCNKSIRELFAKYFEIENYLLNNGLGKDKRFSPVWIL